MALTARGSSDTKRVVLEGFDHSKLLLQASHCRGSGLESEDLPELLTLDDTGNIRSTVE